MGKTSTLRKCPGPVRGPAGATNAGCSMAWNGAYLMPLHVPQSLLQRRCVFGPQAVLQEHVVPPDAVDHELMVLHQLPIRGLSSGRQHPPGPCVSLAHAFGLGSWRTKQAVETGNKIHVQRLKGSLREVQADSPWGPSKGPSLRELAATESTKNAWACRRRQNTCLNSAPKRCPRTI